MNRKKLQLFQNIITWMGLVSALTACEQKIDQNIKGPLTFEVTLENVDGGTPEEPLPFSRVPRSLTFSVRAIDLDGNTATWFDSEVALSFAPHGNLALGQAKTLRLTAGQASHATVSVERLHGRSSLWVEDTGTKTIRGSYAVGLSKDICVDNPFLSDIQQTDSSGTSFLKSNFVHVNFDARRAIVTGITKDGFYVTDVLDPENAFNALFVYTHSLPKSVSLGTEILFLSGTVDEYYGFTELGFPSYQVGDTVEIPAPVVITPEMIANDLEMEKRESGLVQLLGGTVCPIGTDFERYGQWAINLDPVNSCNGSKSLVNVVSTYTVDWFNPKEHVGKTIKSITGNLRQHTSARPMWIVYTRDKEDIVIE